MENPTHGLDIAKAEAAMKRAAEKAIHGTREERSGRFVIDDDVAELEPTPPLRRKR